MEQEEKPSKENQDNSIRENGTQTRETQTREMQAKEIQTKAIPGTIKENKSSRLKTKFPIVGMGASAGGLEAFELFFNKMPRDSGMAFIVISHLDPTHVSLLPEILQKKTQMKILLIKDVMEVLPDTVYVIPPNKNVAILNRVLHLMDLPRPRGLNLPH